MTTLSRSAGATAAQSRHTVRYLTLALIALLIATVLVLALALASTDGGSGDQDGAIRIAPSAQSAPLPPSAAERDQPGGLNGPGMKP